MITKWYEYPEPVGADISEDTRLIRLTNHTILKEYYKYWKSRMLEKYSYVEFMTNYTIDDCIADFCIVNWAYEVQPTKEELEEDHGKN